MPYIKKLVNAFQVAAHKSFHREDLELIRRIKSERLTYLSDHKLLSIARTVRRVEEAATSGLFIEAGCALGGSTILIALLKRMDRSFNVYDVFGTIPPPTLQDPSEVHDRYKKISAGEAKGIGGDRYYGYIEELIEVVQLNLKNFNVDVQERSVNLIQGLVQDTVSINQPVAFAHIDVDWYEPVMTCLERISPHLAVGGSIILDDYHDWGGCKKATDEFLARTRIAFEIDDSAGSMQITRNH